MTTKKPTRPMPSAPDDIEQLTKTFTRQYRACLRAWEKMWDETYEDFNNPATYDGNRIDESLRYLSDEAKRLTAYRRKMERAARKVKKST